MLPVAQERKTTQIQLPRFSADVLVRDTVDAVHRVQVFYFDFSSTQSDVNNKSKDYSSVFFIFLNRH